MGVLEIFDHAPMMQQYRFLWKKLDIHGGLCLRRLHCNRHMSKKMIFFDIWVLTPPFPFSDSRATRVADGGLISPIAGGYFFLGEFFTLGTAAMVFTQRSNASLSKTYKLRADLVTMVFSANLRNAY